MLGLAAWTSGGVMAVARTVWERQRGNTTSSGSQRAVAGAKLLEEDGAGWARVRALRRSGSSASLPSLADLTCAGLGLGARGGGPLDEDWRVCG